MPAAQSFIQILGTFLTIISRHNAPNFQSIQKKSLLCITGKMVGITGFIVKKFSFFYAKVRCLKGMQLRFYTIYYFLLIFIYIFFSSHEIVKFVF